MTNRDIKVTDKRMFTAEGELRDEYRFLETEPEPRDEAAAQPPPPRAAAPEPRGTEPPAAAPSLEIPGSSSGFGGPSFLDLVSALAEPAAIYLGDAVLPDGSSAEDLEMARLHIDLLDVLRQKTVGNLTAQEAQILEDLLYRLRLRYVQKRG